MFDHDSAALIILNFLQLDQNVEEQNGNIYSKTALQCFFYPATDYRQHYISIDSRRRLRPGGYMQNDDKIHSEKGL
jgi:hypothetical protein